MCISILPSASRRKLNGSTVVPIGVDRREVGSDDGLPAEHPVRKPRRNSPRKFALKGSVKVTIDDACEEV
jgi:hypothetical protein